jgi:Dipeptidyl peptidase IV (DPP IV) N-terminal region
MRLRHECLLNLCALLFVSPWAHASEPRPKVAFVRDNNVFVMQATGAAKQLTSDGIPKSLLLWSPDGTKLAFLQQIDRKIALGKLVILAEDGKPLNQILVEPNTPRMLRWVDTLEWVGHARIAAGGSVNPSLSEVVVFDVESGKEVDETDSDDGDPVFSLDGAHFATFSGSPHFTPEEAREPNLNIDNTRIYPAKGVRVDFLVEPAWSDDGASLATVAQIEKSNKVVIVLWNADHGVSTIPLPLAATYPKVEIFWDSDTLFVKTADRAWKVSDSKRLASVPVASSVKPARSTSPEQKALEGRARQEGADEIDFWCGDCQPPIRTEKVTSY